MTGAAPQLKEALGRLYAVARNRLDYRDPEVEAALNQADVALETARKSEAAQPPPRTPPTCAVIFALRSDLDEVGHRVDWAADALTEAYEDGSPDMLHAALREMCSAVGKLHLLIERAEIAAHGRGGRDD